LKYPFVIPSLIFSKTHHHAQASRISFMKQR
jgi:hypothetical protein